MKRKVFTPEEREAMKSERAAALSRFKAAKLYAEQHKDDLLCQVEAAQVAYGGDISIYSFVFVLLQMKEQNIEGTPYVDVRTFQSWRIRNLFRQAQIGRVVRKGQHSTLLSFTWLGARDNDEQATETEKETAPHYPKLTRLFHFAQTDPLPTTDSPAETDTAQADEKEVQL